MRSLGWFGCARLPITLLKTYSWREATIFLAAQGRLVDFARYYGSYRLSGGELTMIIAKGGTFAGRPQDFGGKVEHRIILRRVKK